MRRVRRHLTFANIVSVVALFVALGGGAYAAFHLPKNSVRSNNIVNGQVKGADVKESSLKGVLRCPAGTTRTADICYQTSEQGSNGQGGAEADCSNAGLRLPTISELLLVMRDIPTPASGETDYWSNEGDDTSAVGAYKDNGGNIAQFFTDPNSSSNPYRCVTSPGA